MHNFVGKQAIKSRSERSHEMANKKIMGISKSKQRGVARGRVVKNFNFFSDILF